MAFSVTFHQLIRKFPAFECQKHQWMPGCLFNKAYIFPRARCFRLCTLFAQFWIQNKANFHWKIRHFSKPMLELCGWHFDEEYCLINYTVLWNCFLFVCLFLLRISQKLFNQSNRTWNHMFLKTWSLKLENVYSPFWRKKKCSSYESKSGYFSRMCSALLVYNWNKHSMQHIKHATELTWQCILFDCWQTDAHSCLHAQIHTQ